MKENTRECFQYIFLKMARAVLAYCKESQTKHSSLQEQVKSFLMTARTVC